ncbi:INSIG domain-containing protein [Rutstroemia sp. NJR-2017a BBW]|nr:INSIG domain-containing protein [Rutstroemia sp. NJR-2017a BBW]
MLNLTSSTLGGIYSQGGHDIESEPPSTPWGTEADSPPRTQNPPAYRRLSFVTPPPPKPATTLSLLLRSILLFGTGMLYGLLVRHLHDDRQLAPFQVEGIIKPSHDWKHLVFWGIAGVGLGSLLPWFDKFWEVKLGTPTQDRGLTSSEEAIKSDKAQGILGADWILAVRGVGAFVGIAYAIRKLPWASNMQATLTLALVNPVLWYIIDRTKPGLVLSSAVGAAGTALLLASNSDMMPSPATLSRNATMAQRIVDYRASGLEALVSRGNVEAGTWIASVLFCSCVCFGNIGRRLALSGGAVRSPVENERPRRKSMSSVQAARQS